MSRHHIATHVYDYRSGWVRIPPTAMTHVRAEELRDQGYTLVRSRRGVFGSRELPVSWYVRRGRPDTTDPLVPTVSAASDQATRLRDRVDDPAEAMEPLPPQPSPGRSSGRRRERKDDGGR